MSADEYRRKAADFLRRAKSAADPLYKAWLLEQAQSLADAADQAEPKPAQKPPGGDETRPAMQQQQPQPKEDE